MRSGRFTKGMGDAMQRLNASIGFDRRLYREDIRGSLAWAEALRRAGLISAAELSAIRDGLEEIRREIDEGRFEFSEELEDIHMNIESRLIRIAGAAGARLHAGRSRNDQVATDLRLYLRERANEAADDMASLIGSLLETGERFIDVVIPAYTHLQRAQPVLLAHHLLAYAEMFLRDRDRFLWAASQSDVCPLGSAACAGNQFGVDRDFLRQELGFSGLSHNSLDAVSDRDFVCDYLHAASLFLVHLSRLSEDLIIWSTSEFGFVEMDDEVTSGSSMLPQKKNPDACELARGKCGRVIGHAVGLLTTLKGLPLAYNKDLQEDKEAVFDCVDTVGLITPVFVTLVRTLRVDRQRAAAALEGGFLEALSVADYLTRKGVPFREAHDIAGRAVRRAEELKSSLPHLSLKEYRALHDGFGEDLHRAISIQGALEDKDVIGGTSPRRVREEMARLRGILKVTHERKTES